VTLAQHPGALSPKAGALGNIETCGECDGAIKIIVYIEDPLLTRKILTRWLAMDSWK